MSPPNSRYLSRPRGSEVASHMGAGSDAGTRKDSAPLGRVWGKLICSDDSAGLRCPAGAPLLATIEFLVT